jgi:glycosyltransferase involved in cell wall biosynthesis
MRRPGVRRGMREARVTTDERTAILMFTSESGWGGGETQVELLLRGLPASRYRIALAAPPASAIAGRARELGVRVLPVPVAGSADLFAARRLRMILRREPFHIVHAHSSHAHAVAFLATAGWRGPRPRLIVSRRVVFPVGANVFSRFLYGRGADLYLAISAAVRDVLIASGIRGERVRIIRSGVDLEKFPSLADAPGARRPLPLPDDAVIVGAIGALVPNKAHADVIEAARIVAPRVPGARFVIVGEGPLKENLRSLARGYGLGDRVLLTGFRKDSLEILSTFHCLVISSIREGLCTSIMDAHIMGIPVVATNTGGIPELVDDGETGLLVPPKDPEALARAVLRMISDERLRARCVEQAKRKKHLYDGARMVGETEDAYRALLAQ